MRQKEDPQFAEMLNRIRFGNALMEDIDKLSSRVIKKNVNADKLENSIEIFDQLCENNNGALCLLPTVDMVNNFNRMMSEKKKIKTRKIEAEDSTFPIRIRCRLHTKPRTVGH
jgi:hypothetical protein